MKPERAEIAQPQQNTRQRDVFLDAFMYSVGVGLAVGAVDILVGVIPYRVYIVAMMATSAMVIFWTPLSVAWQSLSRRRELQRMARTYDMPVNTVANGRLPDWIQAGPKRVIINAEIARDNGFPVWPLSYDDTLSLRQRVKTNDYKWSKSISGGVYDTFSKCDKFFDHYKLIVRTSTTKPADFNDWGKDFWEQIAQ